MASASSTIETIMRANVRVFCDSSEAGSWYCSNPMLLILSPRHALPAYRFHRIQTAGITGPSVVIALHRVGIRAPRVQKFEQCVLPGPVGFFGPPPHFARVLQHVRFEIAEHGARNGVLLVRTLHFPRHRGPQRAEPRFKLAILEPRALYLALIAIEHRQRHAQKHPERVACSVGT